MSCHGPGGVKPAPTDIYHTGQTNAQCLYCHAAPPPAPDIPHVTQGIPDCLQCHGTGAFQPFPADHANRSSSSCLACHLSKPDAAPLLGPVLPHTAQGLSDCLDCHGATGSVPEPADHLARTNDSCTKCHSAPVQPPTPAPNTSAPQSYLDADNCLSCHGNPSLTMKRGDGSTVSLYVNAGELPQSAHRYLDCTTCHGGEPHQANSPLTKLSTAEKCGTCHQYEYNQYLTSIHGVQLSSGNADVATCIDCHATDSSPHNVVRVLDPTASTYPKNIADTCGKCHSDVSLMTKYGVVEKVYDTYMSSFHGKAMELASDKLTMQELNTATCVNCHGAHDIKAVNDPSSPVAGMQHLAQTCDQCHPGAGVKFASGFLGHKEANPDFLPPVYWGEKFFYVFTRVVLGLGALMVAFQLGRWGVGRLAGQIARSKKED